MKYIFTFSLALGFFISIAQPTKIEYTENESIIANPERGLYHHTEVHTDNYVNLIESTLTTYRLNEAITQILRVFYLEDFRNRPITTDYLDNMRSDFSVARKAGLKVIVRFAYSKGISPPYDDAEPGIVFMHIQQLKNVLIENSDVIAVVQAGFVGTWGEWHYTDGFAQDSGPSNISEEDWDNRAQVISDLLSALPKERMVQIRTPGYKMTIYDTQEPLLHEEAHSGIDRARLGHHNDCFVASSSDRGTYIDPDLEKPFLEQETTYLPMGGETCDLSPPYSDCDNSVSELERFHWSYLNIDYNRTVLDEWDNQGCFDEVELRLGYRYVLLSSEITSLSKPNGEVTFDISLINKGYASPYNPRDVNLLLKNNSTDKEYALQLEEDPRKWPIGESFTINASAGLPDLIENGNYSIYIELSDPYPSISSNPSYAIQMANQDVWDEDLGYNNLGANIDVSTTNLVDDYTGDNYFIASGERLHTDLPTELYGGADSKQSIIFWGTVDNMARILERSLLDGQFEEIAILDSQVPFYKDLDVTDNLSYSYRFKLQDKHYESDYSNTLVLNKSTNDTINIVIDGQDQDWKTVSPIASVAEDNLSYAIRSYFDSKNAHFLLYGNISSYSIYLNTDNSDDTGWESDDALNGMDYLIEDGAVFSLNAQENLSLGAVESAVATDSTLELSIDLSLLDNLNANPLVGFYSQVNNTTELGITDSNEAIKIYRSPLADRPNSLYTENPVNDKTSIEVFWEACQYCNGYELERSDDGTTFEKVGDFDYTNVKTADRGLTPNQKYYYRLRSHNLISYSEYTDIISSIAGSTPLSIQEQSRFKIYPNPAKNWIEIGESLDSIEIFDLSGKSIKKTFSQDRRIDISDLKKGVFILTGNVNGKRSSERFVKD